MESSMSRDVNSVTAVVQQYLHDVESSPTGVEERSHLAQLCSEAILLFQTILKTLPANSGIVSKKGRMMEISLKRSYERMKMWSDENGAADGGLDATLAASRDLQRDTLKYIVSISQTLTERLIKFLDINLDETGLESVSAIRSLTAAVTEGDSDVSSESEFSDSSSCSVKGVLEDLRVDTTCLLDLEPLLCSPILRTDPEPTAILDTARVRWSPHQPYSDKISVRFPMAADDLVARLGKANYERYLRCQEQKATNELGDIPSDQTASAVLDSASSKFHDSGIGSSLPATASAYAETVMSYGMSEGRRVRVPPLPARAKEGLPFECVACGRWVKIATNSAWKQHIYRDLEPWICLEADCFVAVHTFPTRNDWISHLALDHGLDPGWRMIDCPLCRVEVGPGKLSITRHISNHLEEISLSALPADCEFDEETEGSESDGEYDGPSNAPSPSVEGDRIMANLAEEAKGHPQLLDLIKRVAKENAPKDELARLQAIIDQAPKDNLSGFQAFIDRVTAGSKRIGVPKRLSGATDEEMMSELDNMQSKEATEEPRVLSSTSGVPFAQTVVDSVASASNDKIHRSDEARDGPPADGSSMGATTRNPNLNDAPQVSAQLREDSDPVPAIGDHVADSSTVAIEDRVNLCTHEGCDRAVPGHGFSRNWNLRDHMRRVHNDKGSTPGTRSGAFETQDDRQRHDNLHSATTIATHSSDPNVVKANVPSSYWYVAEMNNFPELLRRYGTNWQGIAQHMTTKTATMVKNFYNRHISRENQEWRQIAFEADQRLGREKLLPDSARPLDGRTLFEPFVPFGKQPKRQAEKIIINQQTASSQNHKDVSTARPAGELNDTIPVSPFPMMQRIDGSSFSPQKTPSALGHTEGSQGQPGQPQFGRGLDPRLNQLGASGPIPGNPNNPQDRAIRAMLAQLDSEQRQKFSQLPPDKINELFAKWKREGMLRPGSPQQEMPINPATTVHPMGNVIHPQSQDGTGLRILPDPITPDPNSNSRYDPAVRAMLAQVNTRQQERFRNMPPDELNEWFAKFERPDTNREDLLNEMFAKLKRTATMTLGQSQQEVPLNPANPASEDKSIHPDEDLPHMGRAPGTVNIGKAPQYDSKIELTGIGSLMNVWYDWPGGEDHT